MDTIECESRTHFWLSEKCKTPHTLDAVMIDSIRRMHEMIANAGLESSMEFMEDGGMVTRTRKVHCS